MSETQQRIAEVQREQDREERRAETEETLETLYGEEEVETEEPAEEPEQPESNTIPIADGLTTAEVKERDGILAAQNRLKEGLTLFEKKYGSTDTAEIERRLEALGEKDPAQGAMWRSDYRDDLAAIQNAARQVKNATDDFNLRVGSRQFEATRTSERSKLLDARPALKHEAEAVRFSKHLQSKYTKKQIESELDHRKWVKAYDEFVKESPPPRKGVRVRKPKRNGKADLRSPGSRLADDFYGGQHKRRKSITPSRQRRKDDWDDTVSILYGPD